MLKETEEALERSIKHWRELEQVTARPFLDHITSRNCPLCDLFIDNDCGGCPVYESTSDGRRERCERTPWARAWNALIAWSPKEDQEKAAHFRAAAKAEREFLESLREEQA